MNVLRVNLEDANPTLIFRFSKLAEAFAERNAPHFLRVIFVARTGGQQAALFAQGRERLPVVNAMRRAVGMPPISIEENAHCVTWTHNSKHLLRPSEAIDVVVMKDPDGPAGPSKPIPEWTHGEYDSLPGLCAEFGLKSGHAYGDLGHIELPDRADVEEVA